MLRFAELSPEAEIVYALSRVLSWTHFRQLIYVEDPLKRTFYSELCRIANFFKEACARCAA